MLMPLVSRAAKLGPAQNHQLAQRARRRTIAPQRVGELYPCRQQGRVVADYLVEVEKLTFELADALLVAFVDFHQGKPALLLA